MKKTILEKYEGIVKKIYLPEVKENGIFISEEYIDTIGFELDTKYGLLDLIEIENTYNTRLYVGDKVTIVKFQLKTDNYEDYIKTVNEIVRRYNSSMDEDKYKKKFEEKYHISEDKYNSDRNVITYYEIEVK